MGDSEIDFVAILANFIPGAVASDYIRPGDIEEMVVWGGLSALLSTYHFDESEDEKKYRYKVRVYPFLGIGVGYFALRGLGMMPYQAAAGGLAGALIGYAVVGPKTPNPPPKAEVFNPGTAGDYPPHQTFAESATPPRGQSLQ